MFLPDDAAYNIVAARQKRLDDPSANTLRRSRNDHCLPIRLHIGRSTCARAIPTLIARKFVSSNVVFVDAG
jgi:hypothetical protein